ncbi:MAG: zinc ABC transporter substrate-binding protein [Rhodospirillaceae bacterium]|nr:zinc ABC transporter substrate-binding protein [Rhodospirillaceae bacterium]MYH35540.1 zinc ABC transporter substrate-binding protein [Rhodospirillaceae bacterium]MYK14185.1 zinc ABC transporter substrate-binding protein [Rhodospirillaceae bacterium]
MIRSKFWNARAGTAATVAVLALAAAGAPVRAEAPRVVVTIKPIHALVASVMDRIGTPALLLSGSMSPHGVSLRPSQARMLAESEMVVWTGPALEQSVAKIVRNLAGKAVSLPLQDAPGVRLLKLREGGIWELDDHDHGHGHGEEEGDEDEERADIDAHIWLDPHNAIAMTRAIGEALARADAPNAAAYRANAAATVDRLKALDTEIAKAVRPVRGKRYIVFHDAYQYFEKRYRLKPAGSITIDPHRTPSPRRLFDIRTRILKRGASCVFREPQFEPKVVNVLVRGTSAKVGTLDPVGAGLPAGKDAYTTLLRRLVAGLRTCLTG